MGLFSRRPPTPSSPPPVFADPDPNFQISGDITGLSIFDLDELSDGQVSAVWQMMEQRVAVNKRMRTDVDGIKNTALKWQRSIAVSEDGIALSELSMRIQNLRRRRGQM